MGITAQDEGTGLGTSSTETVSLATSTFDHSLDGFVDMEASAGSYQDYLAANRPLLDLYEKRAGQVMDTRRKLTAAGMSESFIRDAAPMPGLEQVREEIEAYLKASQKIQA